MREGNTQLKLTIRGGGASGDNPTFSFNVEGGKNFAGWLAKKGTLQRRKRKRAEFFCLFLKREKGVWWR